MRRRRAGLLALALLLPLACSVGPPQPSPTTVEIGLDLPLTGAQSMDAIAARDQARFIIDTVYGDKVEGLPIRVVVFDESAGGRRDPVQSARQLSRALASRSFLGVIGPLDSDVAETEIPVATAAHLAVISPTASNACLTKPLPDCDGLSKRLRPAGPASFFRVAPPDDGEAAALVDFAVTRLHASSFAVGSDGQAYGLTLRDRFAAALKARHLTAAYSANLDPNSDAAVDAFLASARQAGANTVLIGGRGEGGACRPAPKLANGLGSGATLLGGNGILGSPCEVDAGAASAAVYSVAEGSPMLAQLAARVLVEAIGAAIKGQGGNLPTREQVRQAVSQSREVAFDGNGDPKGGSYTIYQATPPGPGQPAPPWSAVAEEKPTGG